MSAIVLVIELLQKGIDLSLMGLIGSFHVRWRSHTTGFWLFPVLVASTEKHKSDINTLFTLKLKNELVSLTTVSDFEKWPLTKLKSELSPMYDINS